jgi:hypothetical protein
VPSHTGNATNTLQLAEQISQLAGFSVLDIVKGRKREPWYTLKQKEFTAIDITDEFFDFYLIGDTKTRTPVIIDTVFDIGRTTAVISKLFHTPVVILIHARVFTSSI